MGMRIFHGRTGVLLYGSGVDVMKLCVEDAVMDGVNLRGADLRGVDLSQAYLGGGCFGEVDFRGG